MINGGFLGNFLFGIDSTFVFWLIAFFIFFGATNYVLTKFFKKQKKLGTAIALITSLLITYFTAAKYPSLLSNFFSNIGFDYSLVGNILPWVIILILGFIVWKKGFGFAILLIGLLLFASGIFGIATQSMLVIMVGVVLSIVGLWLWNKRKKRIKKSKGY